MVPVAVFPGPLNYYRPWAYTMTRKCNLPLAPVSSHRLNWQVLFSMAALMGVQSEYLQSAYNVCHVMQDYDLDLPRYLPKYDQPKYGRARHREVRDLGILTRAPDRHPYSLVHPWLLVPKSSNRESRLVTDCSILTKQEYPTLETVGSLHSYLHSLSDGQPGDFVHIEYDFVSYFYQIPLRCGLWGVFKSRT